MAFLMLVSIVVQLLLPSWLHFHYSFLEVNKTIYIYIIFFLLHFIYVKEGND